jgi:hypothetical protein
MGLFFGELRHTWVSRNVGTSEEWCLDELADGFVFGEEKRGSKLQIGICISATLSVTDQWNFRMSVLLLKFERPLGFHHSFKDGRILLEQRVVDAPERRHKLLSTITRATIISDMHC